MVKIEAITLEEAYSQAAAELQCSVTELSVEVVQYPTSGILGFFRKKAIIVASIDTAKQKTKGDDEENVSYQEASTPVIEEKEIVLEESIDTQEEVLEVAITEVAQEVQKDLEDLFSRICFDIDTIQVSVYDENTLYIELDGEDAALLIGKEGYRYKALSYMLFNWINSKYNLQLRLEIAEFLQNQEEAVHRYLESVKESVDRDGRAQTKILDGVLIQIALKELRATYPQKYVAIRSTKDGLKYIIINDYNY